MLRLKKLWIENYKNLQNITIDFEDGDGFSMLIGTNGSGKSNILEVISGIFYAVYTKNAQKITTNYSLSYAFDDDVMELSYNEGRYAYTYNGNSETKENFKRNERFPKGLVALYSGEDTRLWTQFYRPFTQLYTRNVINSDTYSGDKKLAFISKVYWEVALLVILLSEREDIKLFIKNKLGIERVNNIFININLNSVHSSRNTILSSFVKLLIAREVDGEFGNVNLNYNVEYFKNILEPYQYDEKTLFSYFADALLPKNNSLIHDLGIYFNEDQTLSSLSEGEKKLILIQAVCEFLADEKTLLLLDEPDSHINESKKYEMYNLIKKYNKPQVILTTHSPTLTKIANTNEKIILQKSDDGNTSIVECSDVEAVENISGGFWGASAESIIFISQKPLILIEGSSDITCIQGAINIFSQRDRKYIDIDCEYLPMGGASNAHEFIAQLKPCIAPNRKVIVIFDRDVAGGDGMNACIGQGRNRQEFHTHQDGSWFYFMLPKRVQHTQDDYLLEDCFSPHKVKDVALDIVENISGEFKKYPKDLRETIKKRLAKEFTTYSESDLEGFKILLDKIHNIITDQEQCIQVPLSRTT